MNRIPLSEHKSALDRTATIVAEERGKWTVYSVRGGFVLTFLSDLTAMDELFPTKQEAIDYASLK